MDELFIQKLREVRKNPRRMHRSYLASHEILPEIEKLVPNDFPIRDKIDIIIKGSFDKCYCGELSKPNSDWCSITCMNKDSSRRSLISKKNTENSKNRIEKARLTLMERYGVSAVQDIPEIKQKTQESRMKWRSRTLIETFKKYGLNIKTFMDVRFLDAICKKSSYSEISEKYFNRMPVMTILRFFRSIEYTPKFPKQSSKGEREIIEFINKNIKTPTVINSRKIIAPYELDIYLPEKNIAIEYNGIYYHSKLDKNYHIDKTIACNTIGVSLLHIFEDEWIFKRKIIESIILAKLGVFTEKIYARKTVIEQISNKLSSQFLEENHLQGNAFGEKYFGLFYDGTLVSIMVVGKNRFTKGYEIIRQCSKLGYNIVGGFSKLLHHVKKEFEGIDIISYVDRRFSGENNVYSKFGELIRITEPSYFWFQKNSYERISRFKTQKHKLKNMLKENFNPNDSESKNLENNGYLRIYDCGNYVYRL